MFRFLTFLTLVQVKILSLLFYRCERRWLNKESEQNWDDVSLIVFLNHTSLLEPIFVRLAPYHFIWRLSQRLVVPGADVTLKRPVTGAILRAVVPGCIPISRKKDDTWHKFLSYVKPENITAILPEGRMKRKNGLDKYGQPMSVRGGVADILAKLNKGKILFFYSGGLHHIQAPGESLPRLFKTLKANMEMIDINDYKAKFNITDLQEFKQQIINDMNQRLKTMCPTS